MVLPIKVALLLLPALVLATYTPRWANSNGRARRSGHSQDLASPNGGNKDHPPPILAVGLPVQGPPPSDPTHPSNKATSPPNKPAPSSTKSTSPPDKSIPPSRSSSPPPKQPKTATQKSAPPTKSAPTSRPTPPPKQSTHSPTQPKPAPSSTKGSPIPSLPPPREKPNHSAPVPTPGTTPRTTAPSGSLATQTSTSFATATDETARTRARTRTDHHRPGTSVPAPSSMPAPTTAPGGGGGEERITLTQDFSVAFEEVSFAIGPTGVPTHRGGGLQRLPAGTFEKSPALPGNTAGGDWCFENIDCGSPNSICCEVLHSRPSEAASNLLRNTEQGQCISHAGDSGTCDTPQDQKLDACAFDIDCPGFNIFEDLEGIM